MTEIVKMPNRGHSLTIDHGWREVAQTAAVPKRAPGDRIPLGPEKPALFVVGVRNASEPTHTALLDVTTEH